MKLFTPTILNLAASALLATSAFSQGLCNFSDNNPPPGVDPFVGQWAFHWEDLGGSFEGLGSQAAAIGTFDVQRGVGNFLTVVGNMSVNAGGRILRLSATGTRNRGPLAQYQCINGTSIIQGGTLHLSDGSQDTLWQFVFKDNTFSEILMVNEEYIDNIFINHVIKGNAVKFDSAAQTAACNVLSNNGTDLNRVMQFNFVPDSSPWWSLQTQSAGTPASAGSTAAIGDLTFLATNRPGLVGTVTSASGPDSRVNHTRLASTAGSYQVYPCFNNAGTTLPGNGGNMSFQVGPYATQFEYVFINNNLSMAFILGLVSTGPNNIVTFKRSDLGRDNASIAITQPSSDVLYGTLNRWNP